MHQGLADAALSSDAVMRTSTAEAALGTGAGISWDLRQNQSRLWVAQPMLNRGRLLTLILRVCSTHY